MMQTIACKLDDRGPARSTVRRDRHQPGLSRLEECILAARVAAGDHEARDRLVEANLGLVVTLARRFLGRGLELDDLIGEGNLGLVRAAEGFDPQLGTRFSTFAACCISRAMREALIRTSATIRLPGRIVSLLMNWRRAERALGHELGRAPSFEETASSLGLGEARKALVGQALQASRLRLTSSYPDGRCDGSSGGVTDPREGVEERLDAEEARAVAWRLIEQLHGRERAILALRFGLAGECMTLEEVGRRMGVTRERVRQLEGQALSKLRQRTPEGGVSPRSSPGRGGFGAPRSRPTQLGPRTGTSSQAGVPAMPRR